MRPASQKVRREFQSRRRLRQFSKRRVNMSRSLVTSMSSASASTAEAPQLTSQATPADGWGHIDLTFATGAPAAVGEPFAYFFTAQGTEHVNYRDARGHICELWWDGSWHFNDLTAATGAPIAASDPHGYVFD